MSNRINTPLRGFCIPWFALDDITAKPAQAGPRPGAFVPDSTFSKGLIEVSNAQGADLEVKAVQGGGYGRAEFGMRRQAQVLDRELSQWVAPNDLADYHFIKDGFATTIGSIACVTIPDTQRLVIIADTAGISSYVFDDSTQLVGAENVVDPGGQQFGVFGLGADVLPDGRIYVVAGNTKSILGSLEESFTVYVSEDGISWTRAAANSAGTFSPLFAPVGVGARHAGTAQSVGNIIAVFNDLLGNVQQFVSTSLGGSFDSVGFFPALALDVDCIGLDSGAFLVAYLSDSNFPSGGKPTIARLGNASEPMNFADKVELDSADYGDIAICSDSSGVYVYAKLLGSSIIDIFYSADEGASFTKMDRGAHSTVVSDRHMRDFACTSFQGKVALPFIVENDGTNNFDQGIGLVFYGGWQNIALGKATAASEETVAGRASIGSGGNSVHTGIPLDVPHNVGWTQTTTGGSMLISNGGLRIITVAQTNFETFTLGSTGDDTNHLWKVQVQSGGFQGNESCAYTYNTLSSRWSVRYDTAGFTIRDNVAGTTLAAVALDMTKKRIFKAFDRLTGPLTNIRTLTLAYRAPGNRECTIVLNEVVLDQSGAFGSVGVVFGHIASNTTTSRWEMWSHTRETTVRFSSSEFDTLSVEGLAGHPLRKATPLHRDFNDTDGNATFLRMAGGSFHHNEVGQIESTYDYGIENIVPQESPSPRKRWRSPSDKSTDYVIEFTAPDLSGAVSRLGNTWAPGLFIADANFTTCTLDYWNGASWVNVGTWQPIAGFSQFVRNGSTITPAAGAVSMGQYIRHGQLKGSMALLAGPFVRRIGNHGAGVWADVPGSLAPKAVLGLEGITGAESVSGNVILIEKSGLLITYNTAPVYATKWRVRIPPNLEGPDDFYEAGIITPVYFVATGQQWSNGYSVDGNVATASVTDRNNTEYRQGRGGVKRLWSLPYADGFAAKNIKSSPDDPNYLAPDTGLSITAAGDVFELLLGLLRETDGTVPIVAVRKAPAVSGMVSFGVDNYLYGYLNGPAGYDNTAGDDDEATEFNRGSTVTVTEIV